MHRQVDLEVPWGGRWALVYLTTAAGDCDKLHVCKLLTDRGAD